MLDEDAGVGAVATGMAIASFLMVGVSVVLALEAVDLGSDDGSTTDPNTIVFSFKGRARNRFFAQQNSSFMKLFKTDCGSIDLWIRITPQKHTKGLDSYVCDHCTVK